MRTVALFWVLCGAVAALWIVLNLPRRRSDGVLVDVHPYRKMLPYLMVGRNEAIVFYDDPVKAEALVEFLRRARSALGFEVDVTHLLVAALVRGHRQNPQMGRFVAGRRLYERRHIDITFSMKRKRLDREAKLSAVKLRFTGDEPFREICQRINASVEVERSEAETYMDRELALFGRLPRPLLSLGIRLLRWADHHNLLPAAFIDRDTMYCSTFIANLGSIGMNAGFHHLYEYGTCPIFVVAGRIEERPWVEEGRVVVRKILPLRFSYDERIDDGLTAKAGLEAVHHALEHPDEVFGPLTAAELTAAPPA